MLRRIQGWAASIIAVSSLLLVVTFSSYALAGHGALSQALFWLGLGGELNVGSWWSGMLFMSAAILCAAHVQIEQSLTARHAWAALATVLALFSLDEMASLHEYLSARDQLLLVPPGLLGIGLVTYGLAGLRGSGGSVRMWLAAFGLLATVPLQERLQHALEWTDATVYGARALVEEGTEIAAALLFVCIASRGLRASGVLVASLSRHGLLTLRLVGLAMVAAIVAALTLRLPGVATWAGATLFLLCTLLAASQGTPSLVSMRAALYLLASLGVHAVRAEWDPEILGHSVNLRALFFAGWLLLAAHWLSTTRRQELGWLVSGAASCIAGIELAGFASFWLLAPIGLSLWCFRMELASVRRGVLPADPGGASARADPGESVLRETRAG